MHIWTPPLPPHNLLSSSSRYRLSLLSIRNKANPSIPIWRISHKSDFSNHHYSNGNKRRRGLSYRGSGRESPYQVLGVSPSAAPDEIKRAYRRLALKYHPDVNKQANAQEKFMRIKNAYNALLNSDSKRRYDSGNYASDFSPSASNTNQSRNVQDEEFYGFGNFLWDVQVTIGDFLKDLQEEFQNWEASASSQGKPKSLWEELADIGEEFVEFLEKELNIADQEVEADNREASKKESRFKSSGTERTRNSGGKESSIKENIDEIEATLAKLKKELGL